MGAVRHRFTVEEYRKMGEAGIFHEDDRVELVDGEVVEMAPIGKRRFESVYGGHPRGVAGRPDGRGVLGIGTEGYGRVTRIRREGRIVPVTLPNLAFDAMEALPPEG